jgi:GTP-binding protein LepA
MLHLEIIQERLEREFNMSVITTVPNVSYNAFTRREMDVPILVNNPSDLPDPSSLDRVEEPFIKATIITKSDYVGNVMSLCIEKRGEIKNQTYLTTQRVELVFDMPLAEIVLIFMIGLKPFQKATLLLIIRQLALGPQSL